MGGFAARNGKMVMRNVDISLLGKLNKFAMRNVVSDKHFNQGPQNSYCRFSQ
jgi:hypothetical protein